MRPSALTAALNGMLALLVGHTCFDDCANVMLMARLAKASAENRRIGRSWKLESAILSGPPDGGHHRSVRALFWWYPASAGPDEAYFRDERPVELRQTGRSQPFDLAQCRRRIVEQRLDVDALAPRRKRREIARTPRQQVDRAVMIQAAELVERDADLQDALVEIADVATLGAPQQLEGLVLLEEFAAIELLDAFEELRRRELVAGHFLLSRGDLAPARGAPPPRGWLTAVPAR